MYSSNQHGYPAPRPSTQSPAPRPSTQSPAPSAPRPSTQSPAPSAPRPPTQFVAQPGAVDRWSTGLCDCCTNCSNCCMTCWCPCITFGRIAEIVDEGAASCILYGTIYALLAYLTCCGCLLSTTFRSKMRRQFKLRKSPCGDCLVHFCCEPCALCQEYRELKIRGNDMSLGWQGNAGRPNGGLSMAPVVPGGMSR